MKQRAPEHQVDRRAKGHFGLALGWRQRGRFRRSIQQLRRALEIEPAYLEAHLELAGLLYEQRRWADLARHCRDALRRLPEVPELHKMLITATAERAGVQAAFDLYRLRRADRRDLVIEPHELLAAVVVRNERPRLPSLLDHYRRLGVDRFLFVDNGSEDGTVEWLLDQSDVHLWSSDLSFRHANFGSAWFELLLRTWGLDHWCLTLDADELLVYDGWPERTLQDLCRDFDARGLEVATGIHLDLYGDRPIRDTVLGEGESPLDLCRYFDREPFTRRYEWGGHYRNQTIYFGGVRMRAFPQENDYLLSKAPLVRYRPDVVLTSGQHLTNLPRETIAADEICLLHFKFLSTLPAYARSETERGEHALGAGQYRAYDRELARTPDLCLYDSARSVRFEGPEQLRELGVLRGAPRSEPPEPALLVVRPVESGVERPFWSVLITLWNRPENLEAVLEGVLAQVGDEAQIEVVHDGGDHRATAELCRRFDELDDPRVTLHCSPSRLGHPRIFDLCLERARGRWIHILHDDDRVRPGFYAALRRGIDTAPDVGAAFCRHDIARREAAVTSHWRSWLERDDAGIVESWLERITAECRVQFSAMTVRREVFETLGGFSAAAASAFDWEMWIRIASRYRVWYEPGALVETSRHARSETSALLASGDQVRDGLAALRAAARWLPPDRAGALLARGRRRIGLYGARLAHSHFDAGDDRAGLANLRAAAQAGPCPRLERALRQVLAGDLRELDS